RQRGLECRIRIAISRYSGGQPLRLAQPFALCAQGHPPLAPQLPVRLIGKNARDLSEVLPDEEDRVTTSARAEGSIPECESPSCRTNGARSPSSSGASEPSPRR